MCPRENVLVGSLLMSVVCYISMAAFRGRDSTDSEMFRPKMVLWWKYAGFVVFLSFVLMVHGLEAFFGPLKDLDRINFRMWTQAIPSAGFCKFVSSPHAQSSPFSSWD